MRTPFFSNLYFLEFSYYVLYMLLVLCNSSTECSEHGTCGKDGKCLCHDGYVGTDCSSKLIFLKIKTYPDINC